MIEFPESVIQTIKQIQLVKEIPYRWDGYDGSVRILFRDLYKRIQDDLKYSTSQEIEKCCAEIINAITATLASNGKEYYKLLCSSHLLKRDDYPIDWHGPNLYNWKIPYIDFTTEQSFDFRGIAFHLEKYDYQDKELNEIHKKNAEIAWKITKDTLTNLSVSLERHFLMNTSASSKSLQSNSIPPTRKITSDAWEKIFCLKYLSDRKKSVYYFDREGDLDNRLRLLKIADAFNDQNAADLDLKFNGGLTMLSFFVWLLRFKGYGEEIDWMVSNGCFSIQNKKPTTLESIRSRLQSRKEFVTFTSEGIFLKIVNNQNIPTKLKDDSRVAAIRAFYSDLRPILGI